MPLVPVLGTARASATITSWTSSNADFALGDGWAAYAGPHADHSSYAHVAIQLAAPRSSSVRVILDDQPTLTGRTLIIGPRVRHRMTEGAAFAADQAMKCCECRDKMAERGGVEHDMPMPAPAPAPERAPQPAAVPVN